MAEQEIRATHEEVEGFVAKLRDFHSSLDPAGQAMLGTILASAQQGADATAYGRALPPYAGSGPEGDQEQDQQQQQQQQVWNDLVGWIESQGGEDTQGFGVRVSF